MADTTKLHGLVDVLEPAADTLALFTHHATHGGEVLDATRQTALKIALQLMPEADSIANVDGIDTRRLRHSAASSLLRMVSLSRTHGTTSMADGAAAPMLVRNLVSAANELEFEAAGLELGLLSYSSAPPRNRYRLAMTRL